MSIFRAYDIRGIYGQDLTDDIAEDIGRAFGSTLEGKVAIGADVRLSSPALSAAFARGLASTGLQVLDVGTVPTPLLYFTIHKLGLDGGAMVTGSHNPPEYNGFKMCRGGTMTISGQKIKELEQAVKAGGFREGAGSVSKIDMADEYMDFIAERVKLSGNPLIVLDCANGTAGLFAPRLFERLGAKVIKLYTEPDGTFPNHPADPTVDANLSDLIDTVKSEGADAGFSFDGDADRVGFVDERGRIIRGDMALALFSRQILVQYPGAPIIFEVKCSMALKDDILAHGGRPVMYRTGHSFIKKKIREEDAKIAGEMSGHFFFADDYPGYDDGIYACARMLKLMDESGKGLSELSDSIPKYHSTPEILVDAKESEKFGMVAAAKQAFESFEGVDVITVDGVRVETDRGWGLMRASNTGPKIVMRFEGKTPQDLEHMKELFRTALSDMPEIAAAI